MNNTINKVALKQTNVQHWAPVVIPTLNRFEHLRRCLESLEKCTGAEFTDVHIALDYPPSESYIDGWRKIDKYLSEKEGCHNFSHLFIYRRNRNFGVSGIDDNAQVLIEKVLQDYDRYIFSEDDNEFSPNFLEYMNWGLEAFKENSKIINICGYKLHNLDFLRNNIYVIKRFNGWGIGCWKNKQKEINDLRNWDSLRKILNDYPVSTIFSKEIYKASLITAMLADGRIWGDALRDFLSNEWFCLYPKVSKVRNWGHDGSGLHSGKQIYSKYTNIAIDDDIHFTPIVEDNLFDSRILEIYKLNSKRNLKNRLKPRIQFLLYKLFGVVLTKNKANWLKVQLKYVR